MYVTEITSQIIIFFMLSKIDPKLKIPKTYHLLPRYQFDFPQVFHILLHLFHQDNRHNHHTWTMEICILPIHCKTIRPSDMEMYHFWSLIISNDYFIYFYEYYSLTKSIGYILIFIRIYLGQILFSTNFHQHL